MNPFFISEPIDRALIETSLMLSGHLPTFDLGREHPGQVPPCLIYATIDRGTERFARAIDFRTHNLRTIERITI